MTLYGIINTILIIWVLSKVLKFAGINLFYGWIFFGDTLFFRKITSVFKFIGSILLFTIIYFAFISHF